MTLEFDLIIQSTRRLSSLLLLSSFSLDQPKVQTKSIQEQEQDK